MVYESLRVDDLEADKKRRKSLKEGLAKAIDRELNGDPKVASRPVDLSPLSDFGAKLSEQIRINADRNALQTKSFNEFEIAALDMAQLNLVAAQKAMIQRQNNLVLLLTL